MPIDFKLFIEGEAKEFSSTQIQIPEPISKKILKFAKTIPAQELDNDGIEYDSHITVKWGLHINDAKEIQKVIKDFGPIKATLGKTSAFLADNKRNNDVLKIEVKSKDLVRLNKLITSKIAHTDTYPGYIPHLTIAYLKPGYIEKYINLDAFNGIKITATQVVFSDKRSIKTTIDVVG